ncbi:Fic family protein [Candidatus Nomurabacteria bacterium]|nr:Fic family protein [Candidatus Nomurabacteria bacterium]
MKHPTRWISKLNADLLSRLLVSTELQGLIQHAQEKYVTYDVFRHYKIPKDFKPEEAWAYLKLRARSGTESSPIKDIDGEVFTYNMTNGFSRRLSIIDTHTAGLVKTLSTEATPAQRDQLIMSGLIEEAIASSQIEGANTSRKVAKEMLYSGRRPRTKSEQMIINNYQVMQLLDELKDLDLTEEILLDIQKKITSKTLDEENKDGGGRFRTDADEIAVVDHATGEVVFIPPKEEQMKRELKRLIEFANKDNDSDGYFLHPFIKAAMLHFWIAYLHPFVDGNGRTARAVFYWFLLKKGYWLFQYLSVSRIIKTSKRRYDQSFLNTETDDNDLTYFILYIAEVTCKAIDEMKQYYERKLKEAEELKKAAKELPGLNDRQLALLRHFKNKRDQITDIRNHQVKHRVVYETARQDLMQLTKKGFLVETEQAKGKKIYIPNIPNIRKLLRNIES